MKSLLFDFGGTLDCDGRSWLDRFFALYREHGLQVPRLLLEHAFYASDDNLARRFVLQNLSLEATLARQVRCVLEILAPDQLSLTDPIVTRFLEDCRKTFRRNRPILERLSRRYRLGIISNFYGNLDSVLTSEGMRDLFAVVVDSGVEGILKPDPILFQRALAQLQTAPEECLMVGDSLARDMRGAEGAGMPHALLGDKTEPACCQKAWRIASLPELEEILNSVPLHAGIIAAGDGLRLKASHPELIKPLIPIRGKPLCHWVVTALHAADISDFTVLFNARGRRARESLLTTFPKIRWTFLEKDTASSWESFRLVAETLAASENDFVISTVDAIIPPDEVRRFATEARQMRASVVLALTNFVDDEKPLCAEMGADGRITALGSDVKTQTLATCGLYYLRSDAVRNMPPAQTYASLREYLRGLVRDGVSGIILAKTLDVDRPQDMRQADDFVAVFHNSSENRK